MSYKELLWSAARVINTTEKKPTPANTEPFTLAQGESIIIDTKHIPPHHFAELNVPMCDTVSLYANFKSPGAQLFWKANPLQRGPEPKNPDTSSLMVIQTATGFVLSMLPYPVDMKFTLTNTANSDGSSNYYMTGILPGQTEPTVYLDLNANGTTMSIPAEVYGGLTDTTPNNTQTIRSRM